MKKDLTKDSSIAQKFFSMFTKESIEQALKGDEQMTFADIDTTDGVTLRYPGDTLEVGLEINVLEDGETTPADGTYEVELEDGLYEIVASEGVITELIKLDTEDLAEEDLSAVREAFTQIIKDVITTEMQAFKTDFVNQYEELKSTFGEQIAEVKETTKSVASRVEKAGKTPAAKTEFNSTPKEDMSNMNPKQARNNKAIAGVFNKNK